MIVVDTSALMAILFEENEAMSFSQKILADASTIGAGTVLEAYLVGVGRMGDGAIDVIDRLIHDLGITIVAFDEEVLPLAQKAHMKFGRGRHKASLNFGDCMSYALAKFNDAPLLCKGDDFKFTDVKLAAREAS